VIQWIISQATSTRHILRPPHTQRFAHSIDNGLKWNAKTVVWQLQKIKFKIFMLYNEFCRTPLFPISKYTYSYANFFVCFLHRITSGRTHELSAVAKQAFYMYMPTINMSVCYWKLFLPCHFHWKWYFLCVQ
jgi:hypothetical protein